MKKEKNLQIRQKSKPITHTNSSQHHGVPDLLAAYCSHTWGTANMDYGQLSGMRCVYTPIITTVNTSEHESSLSPAVHAQQPQYSNYTQNNAADDMGEKSDLYAYRP